MGAERVPFFDFDSKEYDGFLPSLAWLIGVLLGDIETRIPYYIRLLQVPLCSDSWLVLLLVVVVGGTYPKKLSV